VQYFPSVEYLEAVLHAVTALVRPGGRIFIGDVRSLPLAPIYQALRQSVRAEPQASAATVRERVLRGISEERELVLDPEFFLRLVDAGPPVSHAQVLFKHAVHANEMSMFRYDVELTIDGPADRRGVSWRPWPADGLTRDELDHVLIETADEALAFSDVPNHRTLGALAAARALDLDVGTALTTDPASRDARSALDPAIARAAADDAGRVVLVSAAAGAADGAYDLVFLPQGVAAASPEARFAPRCRDDIRPMANAPMSAPLALRRGLRRVQVEVQAQVGPGSGARVIAVPDLKLSPSGAPDLSAMGQ
jgi:hypothetical protein